MSSSIPASSTCKSTLTATSSAPTLAPSPSHSCVCRPSPGGAQPEAGQEVGCTSHTSPEKCFDCRKVGRKTSDGVEVFTDMKNYNTRLNILTKSVSIGEIPESKFFKVDVHGSMYEVREEALSQEYSDSGSDKSVIITRWIDAEGGSNPEFSSESGQEGTFRIFDGQMQLKGEMTAPELPPEDWGVVLDGEDDS